MTTFSPKLSQNGFSLIELIISLTVLGFGLLGLINLFMNLSVQNVAAQYRHTATMLAQDLAEEIKAKRFDERATRDLSLNWSPIGIDSGENAANRATFNDVDDYHGWTEALASPYSGFNRAVNVIYVTDGNLNPGSPAPADNDYKRVSVTVAKGGFASTELVTIISAAREQEEES